MRPARARFGVIQRRALESARTGPESPGLRTLKRGASHFPAIVAGLIAALLAPQVRAEQGPTFRAAVEAVRLDVSVQRNGRPVTGLQPGDFEVTDNGVPQRIVTFGYDRWPIDVTVVFDVSASVSGATLDQLRRAVRELRSALRDDDHVRVVTFNMRVREHIATGASHEAIDAAFESIHAVGSSAVLDSIAVALATPLPSERRHLIVLFSDGIDSASITEPAVLVDVARRTTPTIAVVLPPGTMQGIGTGLPLGMIRTEAVNRRVFAELATVTGGSVVSTFGGPGLAGTFRRVLDDFRASYVLHYVPEGVDTGGVHRVSVSVRRSGVQVRSRSEYVAP